MDINGEYNRQPSRKDPGEKFEKWLKRQLQGMFPLEMPDEAEKKLFETIDSLEQATQRPEKKSSFFPPGFRLSSAIDWIFDPSPGRSLTKIALGLAAGLIIGFFLFSVPREPIATPETPPVRFAAEKTDHVRDRAVDSTTAVVPGPLPVDSGTVEKPERITPEAPEPPLFTEERDATREEEVSLGFAGTKESTKPREEERWTTFTLGKNMKYDAAWTTLTTLLSTEGFILEYLDKSSGFIRTDWKRERTVDEMMLYVRVQAKFVTGRQALRLLYEARDGKREQLSTESLASFRNLKALIREKLQ